MIPTLRVLSRSRSILFLDKVPPTSASEAPVSTRSHPRTRSRGPALPVVPSHEHKDEAHGNVDLSILASPLRRDLLTREVLPKDFLLQFKLLQDPAPKPSSTSTLHLTPTSLLHPRFSDSQPGRSVYALCWKEGVRLLCEKKSYKRLSSRASLALEPTLQRVESSLARRVHQEIVLLNKRLVSVPVEQASEEGLGRVVRRIKGEDLGRLSEVKKEVEGWGLKAILDLRTHDKTNEEHGPEQWFGSLAPSDPSKLPIPLYTLSDYLSTVQLPPSSYEACKIAMEASEGKENTLNNLVVEQLDKVVGTFEKRGLSKAEREALWLASQAQAQTKKKFTRNEGGVLGIYGPGTRSEADRQSVPLLKALWRLGLWFGKGWE
ncbi:BZ3500_MvSof-1268-A1-R1_Chr8-2g10240 [Microbotryum saponariae]|uniref:BZ3500_MvSof-1268-A1-R1_Chr8-2g10240 protein n=1 Tax=Microbotryum saponariae TaxID=289078 RepID=A0A2X0LC19_9BASI|nr:BZ3500_MvSof-1268-A1-R1_Chr8-2g10240 [Microbotryum saponariae]SDA02038.1 BZ3501_MvSof-1269-A2-R1_Chr8-2g09990 [Microbotryum saponariae]